MEEDRRCGIRWQVSLPIRYRSMRNPLEGCCQTLDISTQGARLAMIERHKSGDKLSMLLDIPNSGSGPVCFDAEVVWQKENDSLTQECNYLTGIAFKRILDCHKKSILGHITKNFKILFIQRWWAGVK